MTSKWSLMIIGSGINRQHTCYFLLVVHLSDYIAISYRFEDISTCTAHVITHDLQ